MSEFIIGALMGALTIFIPVYLLSQLRREWIGWVLGVAILLIMPTLIGVPTLGSGIIIGGVAAATLLLGTLPVKR